MSQRKFDITATPATALAPIPAPTRTKGKQVDPTRAFQELGLLGSAKEASTRRGLPASSNNIKRKKIRDHHDKDSYSKPPAAAAAAAAVPSAKLASAPSQHSARAVGVIRSKGSAASSERPKPRIGGGMSGMLDTDRGRNRRERTFVGSECAVCEEPLEHTLAGERILQFACGHVSHGACFYTYMKEVESQYCPTCNAPLTLDTSRGGNVLDIGKLSGIVRNSASQIDPSTRSPSTPTPTPWDDQTLRPASQESSAVRSHGRAEYNNNRDSRGSRDRDSRDGREQERYAAASRSAHTRSNSDVTGATSSVGYPETTLSGPTRRHDYDLQSMEASLQSPRQPIARNPIPDPSVSIRSEFPTLNRSRQQQTLTCLITIEVPDNKWKPDPDDLQITPVPTVRAEEPYSRPKDNFARPPPSPPHSASRFSPYESPAVLEEITENLRNRVENWHGLDFERFGKLRLYGTVRVGKDKQTWQELECFLFGEMLICVKEKKTPNMPQWDEGRNKTTRCTLKGSILIRKHLNGVIQTSAVKSDSGLTQRITSSNLRTAEENNVLTLSLTVAELPQFHLQFESLSQLKLWQQALLDLNPAEGSPVRSPDYDTVDTSEGEDEWQRTNKKRVSSVNSSSNGLARSATTALTEYTARTRGVSIASPIHVPVDIVVVVPISSSMQGVKISIVRDALKFMVANLGDRDRMGLVTFGSSGGGVPLVGMTSKTWPGWSNVLSQVKPVGQKSHRADVVEGANVAMDLLMQRKHNNPIATILLISDSSTSDADSVDFVVSRAEAAKIAIHSFGLGMTHKPDTMIELSTRTKASYTYVKDWMMLRECLAGCLGALQSMSHQNVKLKLRLPEGSPAKFVKISGALQISKRAAGRDAEAALGDLRFGDKRDILVQLVITPDTSSAETVPQDPWESIVSGLEALGGPLDSEDSSRAMSIEEVPLIQADLNWGDILRDGTLSHLPRPSLLAITMLPAPHASASKKSNWATTPPIPPHPSVVQRRMELLTSDMLTRALTLVSRGQHDRAQHLLSETRSILKGLGKGGLPPIPASGQKSPNAMASSGTPDTSSPTAATPPERRRSGSPTSPSTGAPHNVNRSRSHDTISAPGIDAATVSALDAELEASLEWINHPAVFGRDSRKAVLQAIGVIASQRGYTFRSPVETLWAARVSGIRRLMSQSREWREEGGGEGGITEEC
ncbi:MAG: hypothetical protein M1818_007865 [Claussenomyces sp. TS43310]|nr:MAG: hypothetical protein M1818_007865 [Claussenomyces sp. TS43310]